MPRKFFFVISLVLVTFAQAKTLDLTDDDNKLVVLKNYSGRPDKQGIFEKYELTIPKFKRAVYYRGPWWPYGGNRVLGEAITAPQVSEGGLFLLLELADGKYLAILPLCGSKAYSWFDSEDGKFVLKFGTRGTAEIKGDMPLVSWATADGPYQACYTAWRQACENEQLAGWVKLREKKVYPEMFKYLGWCSWEGYRKKISSEKLVKEFKGLEASEVPIRYFLVDDGHFDSKTLAPLFEQFANGYKPLTDLASDDGIRWVGMWHALLGNNKAMDTDCDPSIKEYLMAGANGRMVPKPDTESMEKFLRRLFMYSVRDKVDFVKVDFYGILLPTWAGTKVNGLGKLDFPPTNEAAVANPTEATVEFARLFQTIVAENFNGLMNCNWHIPHFIFNSKESVVGRCSEDYLLGSLKRAKSHIYGSYSSMPWLGQVAWGDHDMFHSSDKVAGRLMAVSKAVSGGPVYLSDKYQEIIAENVWPLCYLDGKLLRPIAPAAPLPDDIFQNVDDKNLYRVAAPLENETAVLVLYNLTDDEHSGGINEEDYRSAAAMIQPFPGNWDLPAEGLVVFDHYNQKATKLNKGYSVTIKGFGDRLLQVSPIQNGWSVIGRTDKYLSAAAVENISSSKNTLEFTLVEQGPFAIWLSDGDKPAADGIEFDDLGGGLFEAHLPIEAGKFKVVVRRE